MDKAIVLDGEEFLICRELKLDGKKYIYAVSTDEKKYTVLEEKEENGEAVVESLTDQNEINKVMGEILKENI